MNPSSLLPPLSLSHTNSFRYDPQVDVPVNIEGEQDRVMFTRTIAQIVVCH